jgi:hypothetical protein
VLPIILSNQKELIHLNIMMQISLLSAQQNKSMEMMMAAAKTTNNNNKNNQTTGITATRTIAGCSGLKKSM